MFSEISKPHNYGIHESGMHLIPANPTSSHHSNRIISQYFTLPAFLRVHETWDEEQKALHFLLSSFCTTRKSILLPLITMVSGERKWETN